jgi:hypothetical protein
MSIKRTRRIHKRNKKHTISKKYKRKSVSSIFSRKYRHRLSHRKHNKKSRKNRKSFKGGYGKGAGPIGFPYIQGDVGTWPGVAGVDGQSNYYPLSDNGIPSGPFDPPVSTRNMEYPYLYNMKKQSGGGLTALLPQDLVNFGNSLTGGVSDVYNGYQGKIPPISNNPYPTYQPRLLNPNPEKI